MPPTPKHTTHPSRQGTPTRTSAFTLIELLAVITIIGILAAIIIPVAGRVRETARASQCASNLRQLASALVLFANDNRGAFPPGYVWDQSAAPYLTITLANPPGDTPYTPLLHCPSDKREAIRRPRSYVGSAITGTPGVGVFTKHATKNSLALNQLGFPSRTILLAERYDSNWQFGGANVTVNGWLNINGVPQNSNGSYYHGKGHNYAFADGHVSRLTPKEVWNGQDAAPDGGLWRAY